MTFGFYSVSLLLFTVTVSTVWAQNSKIISKNTYLTECPCSPTKRGFNNNAFNQIVEFRKKIDERAKEDKAKDDAVPEVIQQFLQSEASKNFKACAGNHGWEECINADAAIRRGPCYPDCTSFCRYDVKTWKNLDTSGKFVPTCDTVAEYKSDELDKDRTPDFLSVTPPPLTPTNTPTPNSGTSSNSGENSDGSGTGTEDTSSDAIDATPGPSPGGATTPTSIRPDNGCIAVEHLVGLPKQHRKDRLSEVLCGRGFCATANHAIIVNGIWTSMGRLCSSSGGWKCVTTMKEVNNLNVFKLRRASVGDVTITPYDLRFPRWGVFLLQALEKLLYFVVDFSLSITLAALFVHATSRSVRSHSI